MFFKKPPKVLRTSDHEIPMGRHFLGLNDEISWEMRGTPTRDLPVVITLTELPALLFLLKDYTTVVISVEEIRLFNANNHEAVRFRFPQKLCFSKDEEVRIIRKIHSQRLKVIQAITGGASGSTLTTVSFIPGEVDQVEYGMDVLEECWQTEVSEFCATLHRNPKIRHVHIETKLCEGVGWSLNIEQLLNSSLVELSLPDLKEQGWRDLAAGLAWNRTLRVLTLRWNPEGMDTLLRTPLSTEPHKLTWTECNKTLEMVWISCPREFDVNADAEAVASMLHRFYSVPAFVIEYTPPEPARSLLRFASFLRQALLVSPNVRVLHLLVPFQGLELSEHILKPRTLAGLVLLLDRCTKADLEAVGNMARESKALRFLGLRHQNPKKKLSLWKYLQQITEVDVVVFLGRVAESNLHTLSLSGWSLVDGKEVLSAVVGLMRKQTHLEIDLTGTGLALKNMPETVNLIRLQRLMAELNRYSRLGSDRSVTSGSSSSFFESSTISDHSEFATEIGLGPGSLWSSTSVGQQQQQRQPLQIRLPRFFSSFTYDQLEDATGKFQTVLGHGGFGKVYLGELVSESGKKKVVVKDLKLARMGPGSGDRQIIEKSFEAEVKTLGLIHHLNLVNLFGYCSQNGRLMLVEEFMPNSSLDQWMFGDDPQRLLGWELRKSIAVGVARGLEFLHFGCDPPIIHLDVKPQNILLDANFNPKLADFAIAKLVDLEVYLAQATRCYMAPEIQLLGHGTRKSDVFSYGLLLIELIRAKKNGDMQVENETSQQRFFPSWARTKFQTGDYLDAYHELRAPLLSPSIPGYQAAEAQRMLFIAIACINEDMDMRPDMATVLLMLGDVANEFQYDFSIDEAHVADMNQELVYLGPGIKAHEPRVEEDGLEISPNKDKSDIMKEKHVSLIFSKVLAPADFLEEDNKILMDALHEEIMKFDYISEVMINNIDLQSILCGKETIVLCHYDPKNNLFEFHFKDREDMASIAGIGLKHAKVVLEEGWKLKVKEIPEKEWDHGWNKVESSSTTLYKLLKLGPFSPVFTGRPFLWDLAKYFTLKESIAYLATEDVSTKYSNDSGGSSSNSQASNDEGKKSLIGAFVKWFQLFRKGDSQDDGNDEERGDDNKESHNDGQLLTILDKNLDSKVSVELLEGGEIIGEVLVGGEIGNIETLDEKTRERLKSLDKTIVPNLEFTFVNQNGIKEVQITVGFIWFNLGWNDLHGDSNGEQIDWFHNNLRVSFGLLEHEHEFGELKRGSFKHLDVKSGMENTTLLHTKEDRKGKQTSLKFGVDGKVNGIGLSGSMERRNIAEDTNSQASQRSSERHCDYTRGGLHMKEMTDPHNCQIACQYYFPYSNDIAMDLQSPTYINQAVKFQGIWIPIDEVENPPSFVEYTLRTSRHLQSPKVLEKGKKKSTSLWRMIINQNWLETTKKEELPKSTTFEQVYQRKILVNHSMTHLNGKFYELRELQNQTTQTSSLINSNRTKLQWTDPLIKLRRDA